MSSYTFGSGKLFFKHPTTSQVYQVAVMTDVTLNNETSTKSLMGNKQMPIKTVVTSRKLTGKATFNDINGALIAAVFSGSTVSAGGNVLNEVVGTGASVTVLPTGSAFYADYGVVAANGNPMTLTASAPAVGSYSRTTNVYTFNASEPDSKTISYAYTTGSGQSILVTNQDMGSQITFSMFLQEKSDDGEIFNVELYSVVVPSLNFSFKNEDFASQDLTFEAYANASGQVGKFRVE